MTRAMLRVGAYVDGPSVHGPAAGVRVTCALPDDADVLARRLVEVFPAARRGRARQTLAGVCAGLADALAGAVWGRRDDSRVLSVGRRRAELLLGCPRVDLAAPLVSAMLSLIDAVRAGERPPVDEALAPLLERRAVPPTVFGLAEAAWARGVPASWPFGPTGPLVLGCGARRRIFHLHRVDGLATSDLVDDKLACAAMLQAAGLPTTDPVQVGDVDDAVARAAAMGFPVVLKPRLGRGQVGVWAGLRDAASVAHAYARASAQAGPLGGPMLLERHRRGVYLRATLVGGEVVAALAARPPTLVTDGVHDLDALLRRRFDAAPDAPWSPRDRGVFEAVLGAQGYALSSVPPRGRRLRVGLDGHGASVDVTDDLHPTMRAALTEVGRIFPLPVLAVELFVRRPDGPFDRSRDAIFEVNAAPDLTVHAAVDRGAPRDLAAAVVARLFPRGGAGARSPVVAASKGGAAALRAVARALRARGVSCAGYTDGVAWTGAPTQTLGRGPGAERLAAMDERAEVLLVEVDDDMAARRGLPFDRVDLRAGPRREGPVDALLDALMRRAASDVDVVAARAVARRAAVGSLVSRTRRPRP